MSGQEETAELPSDWDEQWEEHNLKAAAAEERTSVGHFVAGEDEIQAIYDSVAETGPGPVFLLPYVNLLLTDSNNAAVPGRRFECSPRARDDNASSVPEQHPLCAIVKVMDEAADDEVIRMYVYSITDPFVVDTIVHCTKSKNIRVILHPAMDSVDCFQKFCRKIPRGRDGTSPKHQLSNNVEFRAYNLKGLHCNEYTSMNEKSIITASRTLVGSYNLSYHARIQNKESMYCLATAQEYIDAFDRDWALRRCYRTESSTYSTRIQLYSKKCHPMTKPPAKGADNAG